MSDAVITCWQFILYCDEILRQLGECHEKVQIAKKELVKCLDTLHVIVSSKNVIPAADVYPWFVYLAKLWFSFQDETLICGLMKSCHEGLLQLLDEVHHLLIHPELASTMASVQPDPILEKSTDNMTATTTAVQPLEEWRLNKLNESAAAEETSSLAPPPLENASTSEPHKKFTVLHRSTTSNFQQLRPSFLGFCPVAMVIHDGLLVRGNPDLGYVQYDENGQKLLAFVARQHAHAFALKPEHFLVQMMQFACEKPELIHLLQLYDKTDLRRKLTDGSRAPDESAGRNLKPLSTAFSTRTLHDSGCQTEIHPVKSHIDRDYRWNEWDMRKKAIFLANLRSKKTTSSQTLHTNNKRECESQVYVPRPAASQTLTQTPSNVPPPKRYLLGLKGGQWAFQPIKAQNVVLTLPLADWPY